MASPSVWSVASIATNSNVGPGSPVAAHLQASITLNTATMVAVHVRVGAVIGVARVILGASGRSSSSLLARSSPACLTVNTSENSISLVPLWSRRDRTAHLSVRLHLFARPRCTRRQLVDAQERTPDLGRVAQRSRHGHAHRLRRRRAEVARHRRQREEPDPCGRATKVKDTHVAVPGQLRRTL